MRNGQEYSLATSFQEGKEKEKQETGRPSMLLNLIENKKIDAMKVSSSPSPIVP